MVQPFPLLFYYEGYLHLEIPLQVTRLSGKAWQIVLLSAVRHLLSQHSWFIGLQMAPLCSLHWDEQQWSPLNPASHSSSASIRPLPQTVRVLLSENYNMHSFFEFFSSSGTSKIHLIMLDYSCTTLRIGFSYLWSTQVPWILSHYKYIFYYRKKKSERKRTSSSVVYTQQFRIKLLKRILYCVLTWLLCSYPLTEYGYMRYFPPFSTPGAQPGVSGSCSLPQLWPIIRPQTFLIVQVQMISNMDHTTLNYLLSTLLH